MQIDLLDELVGEQQQRGAQQRRRQQLLGEAPRAEQPGQCRRRQADETDQAHRGHRDRGQPDGEREPENAHVLQLQAQAAGAGVVQRHHGQRPHQQRQQDDGNGEADQQEPDLAPVVLIQRAPAPDQQRLQVVFEEQQQAGVDRSEIQADHQAGEHQGHGFETATPGEPQNEPQCERRAQQRARLGDDG